MFMKRYSLLFFSLISFYICIFSQAGHIFVSDFYVDNNYFDSKVTSIEFDSEGLSFVAGRSGVAIFDGIAWESVNSVPQNVNKIKLDTSNNNFYLALKGGVGIMSKGTDGDYSFKYLRTAEDSELNFNKIIIAGNSVAFYSDKLIYILDNASNSVDSIVASEKNKFAGIINRKTSLYVNIENKGFHKIDGSSLKYISTLTSLKSSKVLFTTSFNNKNILFGTNKNKIYLFDGKKFIQFAEHTEIRDFLQENILWDGIDFSGKYFALTTLTGGCAIIDKSYGKIVNVINYQTGLPDDEIYAIAKDVNNGIWLSHEHGISRCDPELKLRVYSSYLGISGNINDVLVRKGVLFTATNDGVYYLEKVAHKKSSVQRKSKKNSSSRLRNIASRTQPENRNSYLEQSITHQYRRVSNLNEKCKKLYELGDNLIALTNFGVYEISEALARPMITNIYPNDILVAKDTPVVYVAALDGVYELSYKSERKKEFNQWSYKKIRKEIQSQVFSIALDDAGNLFLGLDSKALICSPNSKGGFNAPRELILPEKTDEPINLILKNGEVYFIQSTGVYVYNAQKDEVFYHDIRSITTKNLQYIIGESDAWIKETNLWEPVANFSEGFSADILSAFKNIRKIYTDKNNELWMVFGTDQLLKIPTQSNANYDFKLSIKSLRDNANNLYELDNALIPYSNNAIRLTMSAPFYLRPEEIQYSYMIKGLKNYEGWSEWTSSRNVELSSIKAGKYTISLKARNVFNQITDIENVHIKILKPFWQTQSFLIGSIVSLFILIGLAFYLSNIRLLRKKRVLEEKVRERTVQLQEEKDKTETLLLNILPKETAEELKEFNKVVPRKYNNVTVLFTDFKGFTMLAEKLTPEELINEIDLCFKEFDAILGRYRIEKIKTIGDAYMCAGGLPTKYKNNSLEVVNAALEIRDYMLSYAKERKSKGEPYFEIRIGVHSGEVIAGVVGTKKYAYDIWGDTVNLASRMESSGEPGKVNISGDTYKLVKSKFVCTHRGKIKAKNKGEVDMYFVDGIKGK